MMASNETADKWLDATAALFAKPELELIKGVILKRFGTSERALYMCNLFPGRFVLETRGTGLFDQVFGNATGDKYVLVDKLQPAEVAA